MFKEEHKDLARATRETYQEIADGLKPNEFDRELPQTLYQAVKLEAELFDDSKKIIAGLMAERKAENQEEIAYWMSQASGAIRNIEDLVEIKCAKKIKKIKQ